MGKSTKNCKEEMIRLFGPECFIEKLHLRPDNSHRVYHGKSQYKRMKQLTYHHIQERRNGGPVTVENGALLSEENHIWFNEQTPEKQKEMNEAFQEYKRQVLTTGKYTVKASILHNGKPVEERIITPEIPEKVDDIEIIPVYDTTPEELQAYNEYRKRRAEKTFAKFGVPKKEVKHTDLTYRDLLFKAMMEQIIKCKPGTREDDLLRLELMEFMGRVMNNYDIVKPLVDEACKNKPSKPIEEPKAPLDPQKELFFDNLSEMRY